MDKVVFLYMNTRALKNKSTEELCNDKVKLYTLQAEDKEICKWQQGSNILGKRVRDNE
jgi:hypothetical protein